MYESTYGFRAKPFALQPDPDFLYLSANHRTALSFLEYGILNQAGFSVITGEIGAGKTTLLRKILQEADQALTVGFIAAPHQAFGHLMQWVLMGFRLDSTAKDAFGMFQEFTKFLLTESERGRRVILVVDEAQNLDVSMLEQLRLLSNINVGDRQVLQVVLSGQPGLRDLLRREELVQFAQRVLVDHHLGPMDERDTRAYIEHRLRTAGGTSSLFTEQACGLVFRATGGIPRLVNQLCEMALVYGFAERADRITSRIVADACKDKRAGGLVPLLQHEGEVVMLDDQRAEEARSRKSVVPREPTPSPRQSPPQPPDQLPHQSPHQSNDSHDETAQAASRSEAESRELSVTTLQRAQALHAQGRHDDAICLLKQATKDSACWLKTFALIGACHRAAGRPTVAVLALRRALADQSAPVQEIVAVRYELAGLLEMMGKKHEAIECYLRIYQLDPNFQDAARQIERLSTAHRSGKPWFAWARLKRWRSDGYGRAS